MPFDDITNNGNTQQQMDEVNAPETVCCKRKAEDQDIMDAEVGDGLDITLDDLEDFVDWSQFITPAEFQEALLAAEEFQAEDIYNPMPAPSSVSSAFLQQRSAWTKFIADIGLTYGGIEKCVFVFPGARKHKGCGYKCPTIEMPWKAFDDPPVFEFNGQLWASKSIKCASFTLSRENYLDNAIAVLPGQIVAMAGEDEVKKLTDHTCFYFMGSANVNNCALGLYLDVSDTMFKTLHQSVTDDECAANCEVVSCIDDLYQCEILVLRILRNIRIGEQLVLSRRHRHPFQINTRGHGRKLTWFKDVTFVLD